MKGVITEGDDAYKKLELAGSIFVLVILESFD